MARTRLQVHGKICCNILWASSSGRQQYSVCSACAVGLRVYFAQQLTFLQHTIVCPGFRFNMDYTARMGTASKPSAGSGRLGTGSIGRAGSSGAGVSSVGTIYNSKVLCSSLGLICCFMLLLTVQVAWEPQA